MSEENTPVSKRVMIAVKGHQVTSADYRGLLAIFLVVAFIYSVLVMGASCPSTSALGPFAGAAVGYYFRAKDSESQRATDIVE